MGSNSFGNVFKITTWGESHGKAIGVIIDGCPSGINFSETDINQELFWRTPGRNCFVSPRQEKDQAEILSGVFEGKTTGTPISIIIWNQDAKSSSYDSVKHLLRPGHANYTYLQKYGCFDYRGGGRASGRETACRVAAGALAKKILSDVNVCVLAYLKSAGPVEEEVILSDVCDNPFSLQTKIKESLIFCPDANVSMKIQEAIEKAKQEGDSLGGMVEAIAFNVPVGWGDPIYEKLEANLAKAMLSLPASKGFEIGSGCQAATMKGSVHNDLFYTENDKIKTSTNYAGGTLGGISTGMPIVIRVPFKPPSSIKREQATIDLEKHPQSFLLSEDSRHDACLAIRAVPVVEAMFSLVLVDAMLMNKAYSHRF